MIRMPFLASALYNLVAIPGARECFSHQFEMLERSTQLGCRRGYCQIWWTGLIQAALLLECFTSIPSWNLTPVITFAR